MQRLHLCWISRHLGHRMNLLVFGQSGLKVLAFPIRLTSYAMYEKHGIVEALSPHIEDGRLQLYCVDAVDDDRYSRPFRLEILDRQEHYIFDELLPLAHYLNPAGGWATFGICMGGYHAVDLAFRHPGFFSRVVALSGRYDLARDDPGHRALLPRYPLSATWARSPTRYLPALHGLARRLARRTRVVLGAGLYDPFRPNNLRLAGILLDLGVEVALHGWRGPARRGYFWRSLARHAFADLPQASPPPALTTGSHLPSTPNASSETPLENPRSAQSP